MARVQPETIIAIKIRESLTAMGCKVIKIHGDGFMEMGTPDLIGSYRGLCFAIEVKVPGEVPAPIQMTRLNQWHAAGARVGCATNVEEAIAIVKGETKWKHNSVYGITK